MTTRNIIIIIILS